MCAHIFHRWLAALSPDFAFRPGKAQENPKEDTTEARAEAERRLGFDERAKVVVLGALNPKASWGRTPGFVSKCFLNTKKNI